jgi:hypothetical protein
MHSTHTRLARRSVGMFAVLAAVTVTATAWAVGLSAGGSATLDGTTAAARPELVATGFDSSTTFSCRRSNGTTLFSGTLTYGVYEEDVAGTLDFYYRLVIDPTSQGWVTQMGVSSYTGYNTDVDWRIDGIGQYGPAVASRTSTGSQINFSGFGGAGWPLYAGEESHYIFVKTNATGYTTGGAVWLTGTDGTTTLTCGFGTYKPS